MKGCVDGALHKCCHDALGVLNLAPALQAKSFDAPIKLLFPRALEEGTKAAPFSMLGLGDIVIPGIFVALVLRYDTLHNTKYFRR